MSDNRTQAPSRQRRQHARALGFAPHSPDLTAALGMLAAIGILGIATSDLATLLIHQFRDSIQRAATSELLWDRSALTTWLVTVTSRVLAALALCLGGTLIVLIATHMFQTGGLWAPARLVPDLSRLMGAGLRASREGESGAAFRSRLAECIAAMVRVILTVTCVGLFFVVSQADLARLSELRMTSFLAAAGNLLQRFALALAALWTVIGLWNFWRRTRQFESSLLMTPEEQRMEQRAIDGDPTIRSRRLQLARAWLRDPGELLAGASLVLEGQGGLCVLLAGGPPPARITVRTITGGVGSFTLKHAANRSGIPIVWHPSLARRFEQARLGRPALDPEVQRALRAVWPKRSGESHS